ncbi:MAG TPA: cytochrome c [Acidimicrobiales bacterium]|nr:cytochrome c [Acidimicrobiales bacterium]
MTEVPEHLLRRARERRAALTGGAASEGGASEAPAETSATPAPAAAVEAAPAPAAAATPAVPEAPAAPSETYVRDQAVQRTKVPMWAAPVLLILPFWAILYAGAFGNREATHELDPIELGSQIYRSAGCSACHGGAGEGGAGPALADEEVEKTFPDQEAHIDWVKSGSIGTPGAPLPYGDAGREGGQRMSRGGMPAFAGQLSEAEIEAVVLYERERL